MTLENENDDVHYDKLNRWKTSTPKNVNKVVCEYQMIVKADRG
jgi:hypothetical protein